MSEPGLPEFSEHLDTALLLHDPDTGAVLDANSAAENLYGYAVDELTEMDVAGFSSESSRFTQERAEQLIASAADGEKQVFDWQIEHRSGELRWVTVRLKPLPIDGSEYVLAEQEDVTEFKRRTRRLQLLYRIIRHNLRNDMTVVAGQAEFLQKNLDAENLQEQAQLIRDVATQVGEMTNSVKQIESIATNEATEPSPTDVVALLEELGREYGQRYPEADVTVDGADEALVSADRGLRFAFEHAIENAITHSEQPEPEVTVTVETDATAGRTTIRVHDDCPPIPDMEVEALDLDSDSTSLNHGTGVGLFVMKWCTESLGGDLDITCGGSEGNVVEFTFPLYRAGTTSESEVAV